ncbi:MAG: histidine kinase [Chitinophagaceae bacterium]
MFKQKKYWLEALAHLFFWGLLIVILNGMLGIRKQEVQNINGVETVIIQQQKVLPLILAGLLCKMVFAYTNIFYLLPAFSRNRKLVVCTLQVLLLFVVCLFAERLLKIQALHFTPGVSPEEIYRFPGADLIVYLLLVFFALTYFFAKEWLKSEKRQTLLVKSQLLSELNFLKSQINPHFLFNTLNNLFSLAQKNNDDTVANGISKLSGLMRYMIYDSGATFVPLTKEIGYLENFILLNKLRYNDDEAQVNFTVAGDAGKVVIAPIILLPFVENACKHGVSIEVPSVIDISLTVNDHHIIFECSNPVHADRKLPEEHSGVGLDNVRRRLELLYPERHTLTITDNKKLFIVQLTLTL